MTASVGDITRSIWTPKGSAPTAFTAACDRMRSWNWSNKAMRSALFQFADGRREIADRPDFRQQIERDRDVELLFQLHHQIHDRQRIEVEVLGNVGGGCYLGTALAERLQCSGD